MSTSDHDERCARCARPGSPDSDNPANDSVEWEVFTRGNESFWVCPHCLTGGEQRAIDKNDMAFADQMQEEGRVLTGHCARCFRSVPYKSDDPGEGLPDGWGMS